MADQFFLVGATEQECSSLCCHFNVGLELWQWGFSARVQLESAAEATQ